MTNKSAIEVETIKNEHPFYNGWRPALGWSYLIVCTFDFMIAPILSALLQGIILGVEIVPWEPHTIKGGGLYHISMLAIVGTATFGRTREKLQKMSAEIKDGI